jgi:hypothetical protein
MAALMRIASAPATSAGSLCDVGYLSEVIKEELWVQIQKWRSESSAAGGRSGRGRSASVCSPRKVGSPPMKAFRRARSPAAAPLAFMDGNCGEEVGIVEPADASSEAVWPPAGKENSVTLAGLSGFDGRSVDLSLPDGAEPSPTAIELLPPWLMFRLLQEISSGRVSALQLPQSLLAHLHGTAASDPAAALASLRASVPSGLWGDIPDPVVEASSACDTQCVAAVGTVPAPAIPTPVYPCRQLATARWPVVTLAVHCDAIVSRSSQAAAAALAHVTHSLPGRHATTSTSMPTSSTGRCPVEDLTPLCLRHPKPTAVVHVTYGRPLRVLRHVGWHRVLLLRVTGGGVKPGRNAGVGDSTAVRDSVPHVGSAALHWLHATAATGFRFAGRR